MSREPGQTDATSADDLPADGPRIHRRLPRGRHRLSRADVLESQRWRLVASAATLVAKRGVEATTGRDLAIDAGVSSSTLYAIFDGVDATIAAAFDVAAESLSEVVDGACADEDDPAAKLRASLGAAYGWATREPSLASLLGPNVALSLPAVASSRMRLVSTLASRYGTVAASSGLAGGKLERQLAIGAVLSLVAEQMAWRGPSTAASVAGELADLLG